MIGETLILSCGGSVVEDPKATRPKTGVKLRQFSGVPLALDKKPRQSRSRLQARNQDSSGVCLRLQARSQDSSGGRPQLQVRSQDGSGGAPSALDEKPRQFRGAHGTSPGQFRLMALTLGPRQTRVSQVPWSRDPRIENRNRIIQSRN